LSTRELTRTEDIDNTSEIELKKSARSPHGVVASVSPADPSSEFEPVTPKQLRGLSLNPFAHRRASISGRTPVAKRRNSSQASKIQRVLLLNAYPAAYIILWIPGIANRLVEASGSTSKVLQIMQASTQFVGFANAITYGWNERIAAQLRKRFSKDWRGVDEV
jgi:hypothetical protein